MKHYQYIVEGHRVRNSLIHCAGRMSLMESKANIEKVIERNPDCFGVKNDRVVVKLEGLSIMQKSIHNLTEELLNKSIQPTANASAD